MQMQDMSLQGKRVILVGSGASAVAGLFRLCRALHEKASKCRGLQRQDFSYSGSTLFGSSFVGADPVSLGPGDGCTCLGGTGPERGDAAALSELYQIGTPAYLGTEEEPHHHMCGLCYGGFRFRRAAWDSY